LSSNPLPSPATLPLPTSSPGALGLLYALGNWMLPKNQLLEPARNQKMQSDG
jgi:hypothetical protein